MRYKKFPGSEFEMYLVDDFLFEEDLMEDIEYSPNDYYNRHKKYNRKEYKPFEIDLGRVEECKYLNVKKGNPEAVYRMIKWCERCNAMPFGWDHYKYCLKKDWEERLKNLERFVLHIRPALLKLKKEREER